MMGFHHVSLELLLIQIRGNVMNRTQTRSRASTACDLANSIFAVWVAVSPFVLGFSRNFAATCSNIAVGIALLLVTIGARWKDQAFEELVVPLGIWIFLSPFVLGFSAAAFLANNVIMAFIVITAGAMSEGLSDPDNV